MVVKLRNNAPREKIDHLIDWMKERCPGLDVRESEDGSQLVLGLIGNTAHIDRELVKSLDIVENVDEMKDPFKAANLKLHPEPSVISVSGRLIGGGNFALIAGPCSVESREQIISVAESVMKSGANFLRGGAFKPRTSPYDFQGLGSEGLDLLLEARAATGLPIVSELMDLRNLELFMDKEVDIIQIGARNTQNYDLLRELGRLDKPILLKRGLAGTIKELLMSAEYIMSNGNENIILCERGIRTYESDYTRNTLDISAVPVLKKLTHLPVIVDPSHSTGRSDLVHSMTLAAAAAGADGIIVEVHNDPPNALCDAQQSLTPEQFDKTAKRLFKILEVLEEK